MAKIGGVWSKQLESPQQLANLIIIAVAGLYGLSLLLTVSDLLDQKSDAHTCRC